MQITAGPYLPAHRAAPSFEWVSSTRKTSKHTRAIEGQRQLTLTHAKRRMGSAASSACASTSRRRLSLGVKAWFPKYASVRHQPAQGLYELLEVGHDPLVARQRPELAWAAGKAWGAAWLWQE